MAEAYWLTPVGSDNKQTAEMVILALVGGGSVYGFGERTPGRSKLKPGDWLCFYITGKGVAAHARVLSVPDRTSHPRVENSARYPWICRLADAVLYLDNPVPIDFETRATLEAFKDRDPRKAWSWFVKSTREISAPDFKALTRRGKNVDFDNTPTNRSAS
jgi:hypothetical protein